MKHNAKGRPFSSHMAKIGNLFINFESGNRKLVHQRFRQQEEKVGVLAAHGKGVKSMEKSVPKDDPT